MTHSYKVHQFHLVWSTKERKNLIDKSFQSSLYAYMGGIIKDRKGYLLEIGGIANHIHLLISLPNLDNYSELIRNLKAGLSLWLHKTIPSAKNFEWQEGYGSFSVNFDHINAVKKYIQNQEEHHKIRSFEDEYISFLEMHGINYDPRFVFD